jgi:hypothetical protein
MSIPKDARQVLAAFRPTLAALEKGSNGESVQRHRKFNRVLLKTCVERRRVHRRDLESAKIASVDRPWKSNSSQATNFLDFLDQHFTLTGLGQMIIIR